MNKTTIMRNYNYMLLLNMFLHPIMHSSQQISLVSRPKIATSSFSPDSKIINSTMHGCKLDSPHPKAEALTLFCYSKGNAKLLQFHQALGYDREDCDNVDNPIELTNYHARTRILRSANVPVQ